jgi:thiosulfate dehydrogenase (quinone) large subunit
MPAAVDTPAASPVGRLLNRGEEQTNERHGGGADSRFVELSLGIALLLGVLTNLAAIGSIAQSLVIMLSQGGVAFGTGLGAPEFLNVDLIVALLSVIILLSPEAKTFSVDAVLARRTPALSRLLINRKHAA